MALKGFFFRENYQVFNVLDKSLCSILSRIEFVRRTESRSVGYEPG